MNGANSRKPEAIKMYLCMGILHTAFRVRLMDTGPNGRQPVGRQPFLSLFDIGARVIFFMLPTIV
jgi:hypothetical protein